MKRLLLLFITIALLPWPASAKLKVVASTSDLAYFAREVGGDLIEVMSIAPPNADIHFVEIRPSYMMKVARADVALKVGLELDIWMDRIIDGSRNSRLEIVDCSRHVTPLEVPNFKADARHGDLHRFGNPHYWLGPQNVAPITQAIAEGFARSDPDHADQYHANRESYLAQLKSDLEILRGELFALAGKEVIFYHNSWPYFCEFTGLVAAGFIEPYPGVPPSPSHVKEMTDFAAQRQIKVIAVEPYFDDRIPRKLAEESGATLVTLYPSVGGTDKTETYATWLGDNLNRLREALE